MASSYFYQNFQAKEPNVTKLFLKCSIGATGAPTLDSTASKGIASIARTAAGDYTVTLDEPYNSFLMFSGIFLESDDMDLQLQLAAEAVSTATAPTIQIICTAGAVATDPDDGSTLYAEITLKNTSA